MQELLQKSQKIIVEMINSAKPGHLVVPLDGLLVVTDEELDNNGSEVVFNESHVVGVGVVGDSLVDSVAIEGICFGVDVSDTCVAGHEN